MLRIEFTSHAEEQLIDLLEYIQESWGSEKAIQIKAEISKELKKIGERPGLYSKIPSRQGVHKFVFSKQTSIFYQVDSERILVLSVWDNRSNPRNLKL